MQEKNIGILHFLTTILDNVSLFKYPGPGPLYVQRLRHKM